MARRFLSFILGVVTGILILVLGVGGSVYLVLSKEGGMGTVQERIEGTAINDTLKINLSEEQQAKSILEYATGLISALGNLSTENIGDLEDLIGTTALSSLVSDTIGISAEAIRASSLEDIGATVTDNLTLQIMKDKFELELPDMPLFNDEEFLARPVSEAFGSLDNETLDKIIEVVYEDDATEEKPASSQLLQKLGKKTVNEVSSDMDKIVEELYITDVIDVTDESSEVLKYFRDNNTSINGIDAAIKTMKVKNAVKVVTDEDVAAAAAEGKTLTASHKVLQEIADLTLDELSSDSALQEKIDGLKIGDVITVTATSNKVLKYLEDKDLGALSDAIDQMKISDAIDIVTDEEAAADTSLTASSRVLQYFKNSGTTLNNINDAIENMTIGDAVKIVTDAEVEAAAAEGKTLVASSRVLQYLKDAKLDELDSKINMMKISDAVKITSSSHAVLQKIADMTLNQLSDRTELQDRIDTVKIGEVVTVGDDAEPILVALKETELGGLNAKIKDLTVKDVFKDYDVGLLASIPETTKIEDIAETLKNTVKNASLYALKAMGMFDYTLDYENGTTHNDYVKKANMHNANPQDLVNAMTDIAAIDWATTDPAALAVNAGKVQTAMKKTENVKVYVQNGATPADTDHYTYYGQKVGGADNVKVVDITANATKTDGKYVLTSTLVKSLVTAAGATATNGVTLFIDDGIDIVLDGEYDILFSLDCGTNTSVTIKEKVSFAGAEGGYAYFRSANINVVNASDVSSTWADYVTANGSAQAAIKSAFEVKTIYKNAANKTADITTDAIGIEVTTAVA